jgi:hypothetical protein
MTDKISQRPVSPLDSPERLGGEVAAGCPVDASAYPLMGCAIRFGPAVGVDRPVRDSHGPLAVPARCG